MTDKRYLFEYEFNGATYGQEVVARDHYQATLKLEAMANAEYKGEIAARIPASSSSFWRWLRGT